MKIYTVTSGEIYHDWIVLVGLPGKSYCRCKCGTQKTVSNKNLVKGLSKRCRPCGFKGREKGPFSLRKSSLRNKAKNAIQRCTNKDHCKFKHYGGRGIKVYPPWVENLYLFVEYLMTLDGWDNPNLVLDRIENNGDYTPGNLRFVTVSDSMKNRRGWALDKPGKYKNWRGQ